MLPRAFNTSHARRTFFTATTLGTSRALDRAAKRRLRSVPFRLSECVGRGKCGQLAASIRAPPGRVHLRVRRPRSTRRSPSHLARGVAMCSQIRRRGQRQRRRAGRRSTRDRRRARSRGCGPDATAQRPLGLWTAAARRHVRPAACVQRTTQRRVRTGITRATPSSVQRATTLSRAAPFVSAEREDDAGNDLGLEETVAACAETEPTRRDRLDVVPTPGSATVGQRHVLSDSKPAHALQMMAVGSEDLDGVGERIDEGVRRRVLARRPHARAVGVASRSGHDRKADRMRENSPSWGAVTCSPRSCAS